jgi:hypothetical protein
MVVEYSSDPMIRAEGPDSLISKAIFSLDYNEKTRARSAVTLRLYFPFALARAASFNILSFNG